jgi:chemotaxis protein histidine kinase CheA
VSGATPGQQIAVVVGAARARLARVAGRRVLVRRGLWVILGAATLGAARPLYLPLDLDTPLWLGAALALGVAIAASGLGLCALVVAGRRRRPTELAAARTVDEALGLREVVASGFAFTRDRDGREGPLVAMAVQRAASAATRFEARRHIALPSLRPRVRRVALAAGLAALATALGAYHPALASIIAAPPTEAEMAAASELDRVARALDRGGRRAETADARPDAPERDHARSGAGAGRDRDGKNLAEQARKASAAARRGDRAAALKQIDALGQSGRQATRQSRELAEALRKIADALEPRTAGASKSAGAEAPQGAKTSEGAEAKSGSKASETTAGEKRASLEESLRRLAQKLSEPTKSGKEGTAERRRTLESLARAVAESERSASSSQSAAEHAAAEQLAKALSEAGKAAGADNRSEAARQLEKAIAQARELQAAQAALESQAASLAKMLEAAGMLGREMQLALAGMQGQGRGQKQGAKMGLAAMPGMGSQGQEGQCGQDGQCGGSGSGKMSSSDLGRALALRLAALGMGSSSNDPSGNPGRGREGSANNWGAPHKGLNVNGGLRARSEVLNSEGDLAVTAIQGLGRSSEPTKEYRDVYPSYAALAEESVADEAIPAAQRHVVRRYFEVIRPGGEEAQVENAEGDGAR